MTNKLANGDYIPRGSGIVRCFDDEARLHDALFRLQCRRGSFPFLPELGSNLWLIGRQPPAAWEAFARQACLAALNGTGVGVSGLCVTQIENALSLQLTLQAGDNSTTLEVTL